MRNRNLNLIASRIRDLIGTETIEPGQKKAIDRAVRKIQLGMNRRDIKEVEDGIAKLARALLR